MSIIVDPEWTFIDVLQAAWAAYPGGAQFGAPNRVRALERWANVVGCERAVHELNTVLSEYPSYKKAAEAFRMSVTTLKRIRDNFAAMPKVTSFSSVPTRLKEQIAELKETKNTSVSTETPEEVLQKFLELTERLGVDPVSRLIEVLVREGPQSLMPENTLQKFLEMSQRAGVDVVSRLVNWIANTAKLEDFVSVLEDLELDDLRKLNTAIGLSNLKNALAVWQDNKENDNEEFWQRVFSQNSFIFAQLFSFPVIFLEDKAYIGGKSIGNKGGNIIDFLYANNLTKNAALIEIKTPKTKLLGSQYRGDIYNTSAELSGSVVQIANYKKSLLQNFSSLVSHEGAEFDVFNPKSIIVIGSVEDELNEQRKKKSFELFRSGLSDVQIITYDELFGRIEFLVDLLQGDLVAEAR